MDEEEKAVRREAAARYNQNGVWNPPLPNRQHYPTRYLEDWMRYYPAPKLNCGMMPRRAEVELNTMQNRVLGQYLYDHLLLTQVVHSPIERMSVHATLLMTDQDIDDDGVNTRHINHYMKTQSSIYGERYLEEIQPRASLNHTLVDGIWETSSYNPEGKQTAREHSFEKFNPYKVKTGYRACFRFLMSEQVKVKPTLILQQVPNENWVADYKGMLLFNAYKYRVAYYDPDPSKETRDSVYLI